MILNRTNQDNLYKLLMQIIKEAGEPEKRMDTIDNVNSIYSILSAGVAQTEQFINSLGEVLVLKGG